MINMIACDLIRVHTGELGEQENKTKNALNLKKEEERSCKHHRTVKKKQRSSSAHTRLERYVADVRFLQVGSKF